MFLYNRAYCQCVYLQQGLLPFSTKLSLPSLTIYNRAYCQCVYLQYGLLRVCLSTIRLTASVFIYKVYCHSLLNFHYQVLHLQQGTPYSSFTVLTLILETLHIVLILDTLFSPIRDICLAERERDVNFIILYI